MPSKFEAFGVTSPTTGSIKASPAQRKEEEAAEVLLSSESLLQTGHRPNHWDDRPRAAILLLNTTLTLGDREAREMGAGWRDGRRGQEGRSVPHHRLYHLLPFVPAMSHPSDHLYFQFYHLCALAGPLNVTAEAPTPRSPPPRLPATLLAPQARVSATPGTPNSLALNTICTECATVDRRE